MHARTFLSLTIVAVAASIAPNTFAQQDGTFPPGGPEGQRRERGGDPAQMVERMMQMDANGDGKLSRDEMPGPLAERVFDRADTNGDGFVDKAELEAMAKAGGMRGGQGGGQGGPGMQRGGAGGAGGPVNVEGAMKQMNGAYRALKGSAFDASSRAADLEAVQRMQMGIFGAKAGASSLRMSDAAKAKFGEDKAAFEAAYRKAMLDAARISIELELAILDGNASQAKALVAKMHDTEESGHDLFQMDESSERGEAGEAPRRGRGARGNAPASNN